MEVPDPTPETSANSILRGATGLREGGEIGARVSFSVLPLLAGCGDSGVPDSTSAMPARWSATGALFLSNFRLVYIAKKEDESGG